MRALQPADLSEPVSLRSKAKPVPRCAGAARTAVDRENRPRPEIAWESRIRSSSATYLDLFTMKRKQLKFGRGFRVALSNRRSQAAEMVIPPGAAEGGPTNRHRAVDQWLYVVSGVGTAEVNGKRHHLAPGTLLLIERNDVHEIKNTGRGLLRTLNLYVPPGYSKSGAELPPARA